jgi:hypothetical protein
LVLLYSQKGQLANRLWQSAYFIANALENKYCLKHLGFAEYIIYFNRNDYFKSKRFKKIDIIDFQTTKIKDRIIIKYANLSKEYSESLNRQFPFIEELIFLENEPGRQG